MLSDHIWAILPITEQSILRTVVTDERIRTERIQNLPHANYFDQDKGKLKRGTKELSSNI